MAHNRPDIPNAYERAVLQVLRGAGWVNGSKIHATPGFIEKLIVKGWIERNALDANVCYRITDQGVAAKKLPLEVKRRR